MHAVLRGAWMVLLAALAAACDRGSTRPQPGAGAADAGPSTPPLMAPPPGARAVPFVDQLLCEKDEDCVRAKGDCCGCAGGGKGIAVAGRHRAAWEQRLESTCAEAACATMVSRDPSCFRPVVCRKGRCRLGSPKGPMGFSGLEGLEGNEGAKAPRKDGDGGGEGAKAPRKDGDGGGEGAKAPRKDGDGGGAGAKAPRKDGDGGGAGAPAPPPR